MTKKLLSEEDLIQANNNDDYKRQKIIKDVLTYSVSFLIIIFTIAITIFFFIDEDFRKLVFNQFLNNIGSIVVAIAVLLGFRDFADKFQGSINQSSKKL